VRALRFNHFFRGGQLHYRGGVALSAAQALAPLMKDLGRHLQLNLFNAWMPDEGARRKILADNPARLYGFPGS
jgi:hypothetical protein